MGGEPWIAIVVGSLMVLWGTFFVTFRHRISRRAIALRMDYNKARGVKMQAPWVLALAGAIFAIVGVAVLASGITRAIG